MRTFPGREDYEQLIYSLPEYFSGMRSSTLKLYTNSPGTCLIRGSLRFDNRLELQVFEYLDLADRKLLSYSYTILRDGERIRWYDPQPHPEILELAATFPHHYHDPPDIKHHRHPAIGISFDAPNLPLLIKVCLDLAGD